MHETFSDQAWAVFSSSSALRPRAAVGRQRLGKWAAQNSPIAHLARHTPSQARPSLRRRVERVGVVGEDPCSGPGPGLDSGGRTEGPDAMPSGAGLCWDAPAVASGVRVVFLVTRQLACYIEVLLTLDIFSVRGFLCLVGCPSPVNLGSRSTWLTGLSWGSCPWSAWVPSTQRVPCRCWLRPGGSVPALLEAGLLAGAGLHHRGEDF